MTREKETLAAGDENARSQQFEELAYISANRLENVADQEALDRFLLRLRELRGDGSKVNLNRRAV